jgi:single-stranded DNA-binding protein
MSLSNFVLLQGDITGDIYYNLLQVRGKSVPYLRVYMMINSTEETPDIRGQRVVFYGRKAEEAEAYLQKGSRIFVKGHIQQRKLPDQHGWVFEVAVDEVTYLRNITWERGQRRKALMLAEDRDPDGPSLFASLLEDFKDQIPDDLP